MAFGFFNKKEDDNGQHRKAGAQVHGSPAQSSSTSPGGASPFGSRAAIARAFAAGTISSSEAFAAIQYLDRHMTVPGSQASQFMAGLGMSSGMSQMTAAQYHAYRQAVMQQQMLGVGASLHMPPTGAPHAKTSLKSEGIRAGEVIAWRGWNIRDFTLMSVVADGKPWCAESPMEGDAAAGYGIHAYKAPHGPLLDNYVTKGSSTRWVIGEVSLWGDIIEHEEGYRAQYARVHSLVTWHEGVSPEERRAISEKYLKPWPALKFDDAA